MEAVERLTTLQQLRTHVSKVLADHDQLDPEQAPLRQSVLRRRGRPCGLFFQLQGPRHVRTYAVWAGEENRVLFYDSLGRRFAQTTLSEGPDPRDLVV
ncbi:MAG: hypothetical protein ACRC33_08945 [Gemmataceae bacterium]